MPGPCLCGDPYCSSCGDPSLAVMESAEESLMEKLHGYGAAPHEYALLTELVEPLLKIVSKTVDERVKELRADDQMYIGHPEDRIAELENERRENVKGS